jgi:DNA polymerase
VNEFADWRARARTLLAAGVAPEHAQWDDARQRPVLAAAEPVASSGDAGSFRVSQQLYEMLETAACHRDERRFYVMYRLLWRVTHGEPRLLDDAADDDVRVGSTRQPQDDGVRPFSRSAR